MKKIKKITGAITALVTPFCLDGSVDMSALKELVSFQIRGNIDGLVPCGSTGEAATLTIQEYELVIKTVVQEVKGRIPVIAGAGSNDTQKAVLFSKIAKKAGADVLLHVSPFYNKPTKNGLIAHFKAIADAVSLPILVYNVPGRTGSNISATLLRDIMNKVPEIIGVKEASGNILQMMEIQKYAPKGFSLLSGDDALTVPVISIGGVGCISVVSNEVPSLFTQLVHLALEGNKQKAQQLQYALLDLMNCNFIETNPQPVKTALFLMGMIKNVFRLPLVPMEEKNTMLLTTVLKDLKLL